MRRLLVALPLVLLAGCAETAERTPERQRASPDLVEAAAAGDAATVRRLLAGRRRRQR